MAQLSRTHGRIDTSYASGLSTISLTDQFCRESDLTAGSARRGRAPFCLIRRPSSDKRPRRGAVGASRSRHARGGGAAVSPRCGGACRSRRRPSRPPVAPPPPPPPPPCAAATARGRGGGRPPRVRPRDGRVGRGDRRRGTATRGPHRRDGRRSGAVGGAVWQMRGAAERVCAVPAWSLAPCGGGREVFGMGRRGGGRRLDVDLPAPTCLCAHHPTR